MGVLNCQNLVKAYGKKVALEGISLDVPENRIVGLLGPNGSGKTTLLKIAAGLLIPTHGGILIDGKAPGKETKSVLSFLPERTYLNSWMKVTNILEFFNDFYSDFDMNKAIEMLSRLNINPDDKLKTMSKGTKEKVQLILVMSRNAKLYLLDEPIGGVDPAARDYILDTIISNYRENSTIIISTHLIGDVEKVLDDFVFLKDGEITMCDSVKAAVEREGKSIDELFREVFKC